MARTKGWRVVKKAAEEFIGFKKPLVTDKIKAHPKLLELHDRMSQPLSPLKYKLKELTDKDEPIGGVEELPFNVSRTFNGNLPVYTEFRNNRARHLTVVRRITGDVEEFKEELAKVVSNAPIYDKIGRIEVKGLHSYIIKVWLRRLGF